LGFVDADNFRARRQLIHYFRSFADVVGRNTEAGMRDNFVGGIALVDSRLENLNALARNLGAAQAADQLFTFAGKHRADDDFDPTHVALDDVHVCSF